MEVKKFECKDCGHKFNGHEYTNDCRICESTNIVKVITDPTGVFKIIIPLIVIVVSIILLLYYFL